MISEACAITSYDDLVATLAARRHELGLSQCEVDHISGLQEGYTGKVESWNHPTSGRTLGRVSLPLMLQALGLRLFVMTTDGQVLPRQSGQKLAPGDREPAWPNPAVVLKRPRPQRRSRGRALLSL